MTSEERTVPCQLCGSPLKEKVTHNRITMSWMLWELNHKGTEPEKYHSKPFIERETCKKCEADRIDGNIADYLKQAGIPPIHYESTFDNYTIYDKNQAEILGRIKKMIENFPNFKSICVWSGGKGTGKGHFSACSIREIHRIYGVSCMFVKFPRYLNEVMACYAKSSKTTVKQILAPLQQVGLLILDEIGFGYGNESLHSDKILYEIVDARYESLKPTIITTNMSIESLRTYLSEHHDRLESRVFDRRNVLLTFGWSDYRINGGAK